MAALALIAGIALAVRHGSDRGDSAAHAGLPNTPDYHSLLVTGEEPETILLGTHDGLFRSSDGGSTWASSALQGQDAMNLVAPQSTPAMWVAGHDVFSVSRDGGRTWKSLSPSGLPSLDLHGFAVDAAKPNRLYAAVAGAGLFRSDDGGANFHTLSTSVGGAVMALAAPRNGTLFAGDMQRGLLVSHDGGASWREALNAQLAGLAVSPANAKVMLATGPGILRSADGGKTWRLVKRIDQGAGPVAFSAENPKRAFVVGFDHVLYRSNDAGATWTPVAARDS